MSQVSELNNIIKKIDALDGNPNDGWYEDIPLNKMNSLNACVEYEKLRERCPVEPDSIVHDPKLLTPKGNIITLKCENLVQQMNTLLSVASVNPVFKIYTEEDKKEKLSFARNLTYEDFFVYHVVDYMITSLLFGFFSTENTLAENFNRVDFEGLSSFIPGYIEFVSDVSSKWKPVSNNIDAYRIFEKFLKEHNLDSKPFMHAI